MGIIGFESSYAITRRAQGGEFTYSGGCVQSMDPHSRPHPNAPSPSRTSTWTRNRDLDLEPGPGNQSDISPPRHPLLLLLLSKRPSLTNPRSSFSFPPYSPTVPTERERRCSGRRSSSSIRLDKDPWFNVAQGYHRPLQLPL